MTSDPPSVAPPDFLAAAKAYIASRSSPQTRSAYTRDLTTWLTHCASEGVDPTSPPTLTPVAFRDALRSQHAPLTVRRTLASLAAIYAAILPALPNPFAEKALPRPPAANYSKTEAVEDDVARKVIAAAGSRGEAPARDAALLRVLWATGMRRVSAVSIRRDGVLKRAGRGLILRHVLKGGEEVESELPLEAAEAVGAWLEVAPPSRFLFCTVDGARALSPQAVTKIVATAAKVAGVDVHPHMFRAALITRALDAGIALVRVQAAVHHKDPRSTLRYDRGSRGAGVALEVARFRASEKGKVL